MTHPIIVLACVLRTIELGSPPDDARCQTPYVQELATAFSHHAAEVPPDIEAAKCYHESRFNKHDRGSKGEIGICQVKPHGAIQGKDLKLKRAQIEDIETNVRISAGYISQFVRKCKHPSGWLTMYNRPARGCRATPYSLAVLAELRRARTMARKLHSHDSDEAASTRSSPSGWSWTLADPYRWDPLSPSTLEPYTPPGHISGTEEDSGPSTSPDTDERRPAGRRRVEEPRWTAPRSEQELALPFQEP